MTLPEGQLLLHRNASLPWLILVPPGPYSQLHELPSSLRGQVRQRIDELAGFLENCRDSERVNVAAIGNLVPQLHIHVVGRRRDDPAWPGVVWGAALPESIWKPEALERLRSDLRRHLDAGH